MNEVMPLVSIICTAYNQEKFISQALDGLIMQETRFPFEIIVNDDASQDATPDIIRQYSNRHPNLIVPIFQIENQYSKHISAWTDLTFPRARGKYIAICEGDDYWTDPLKLQKQVDFMEAHPEVALCFTNAKVLFDNSAKITDWPVNLSSRYYEEREIMFDLVIPTCSVLFRNEIDKVVRERMRNIKYIMADLVLWLSIAEKGMLYCMNEQMVVYRRNEGSVAYRLSLERQIKLIEQHEEIAKDFNSKFLNIEKKFISRQYFILAFKCMWASDRRALRFFRNSITIKPGRVLHNVIYMIKRAFISDRSL